MTKKKVLNAAIPKKNTVRMKLDKSIISQHGKRFGIVLLKITPSVKNNVQCVSYGILKWGSV